MAGAINQTQTFASPSGFGYPGYDYSAQLSKIARAQALSQALQEQSMTPIDPAQSIGGMAIRQSPLLGIAKAAQGYLAGKEAKSAQDQQTALSQSARSDYQGMASQFAAALRGSPATAGAPAQPGMIDEVGGINDPGSPATAGTPAVAPDYMKAMTIASQHPMGGQLATMAGGMAGQQFQMDRAMTTLRAMGYLPADQGAPAGPPAASTGAPQSAPPLLPPPGAQGAPGPAGAAPMPPAGGQPGMPAPAAPPQASPGPLPLSSGNYVDPKAAALIAMSGAVPALGDIGKAQQEGYSKMIAPQNVRPGGTVYSPIGGPMFTAPNNGVNTTWQGGQPVSAPVPGAQEAMARGAGLTAAAEAGATAPYKTVDVPQQGGGSMPTFLPNVSGFGGGMAGGPAPAAGSTPVALPPGASAGTIPGLPASAQPAGVRNPGQPVLAVPPLTPAPSGAPTAAAPNADPWATIPKLPTPQGAGPQSTYSKELAGQQAQMAAKQSEGYAAQAENANQRIATNNQALSLVDKADTGPGSSFITDFKNLWQSYVPSKDFDNDPASNIALNKDLVNAAIQKGKGMFGSRFTQSEVGLMLTRAAPSADQTKTAVKFLLNSDNAQQQYQVQQANDFGTYLQKGGDPTRFAGWYAQAFPMTAATAAVPLPGAQHPADINLLLQKYGRH